MNRFSPSNYTVQYMDYPPPGEPRGYYITAPDYDHVESGPYATLSEAEAALHVLEDNFEPLDPPGWEAGFAENH